MNACSFYVGPLLDGWAKAAIRLSDAEFGEGYLTEQDLSGPGRRTQVILDGQGQLAGFGLTLIESFAEFSTREPTLGFILHHHRLGHSKSIGTLKTMAIAADRRGVGLGGQLFAYRCRELSSAGADVLVLTGWVAPDGVHISRLATRNGFSPLASVPHFYRQDSTFRGYTCSTCKTPPCLCPATLFVRTTNRPASPARRL